MSKQFPQLLRTLSLLLIMMVPIVLNAQTISLFNLTIRNDVQVSDRIMEFDLYLLDTDLNESFELNMVQAGILVNSGIYNGGTITVTLVSGTSELVSAQRPAAANVNWDQGSNIIKLTPKLPTALGDGTTLSQISPGTRVCRLRITNSKAFTSNSTANLAFSYVNPPYPTKVFQTTIADPDGFELSCNSSNTFSNASNIILNSPPTVNPIAIPSIVCAGDNVQLNAGVSGGSGSYTYTWTSNPVGFNSSIANPIANPFVNTTYNVSVYDGVSTVNGSASVTVNPLPTVNAGSVLSAICQGGTTVALGGSFGGSATSALWSDGGAGGSFANNSGTTPGTATYTANISAPSSVTLTLTTSGGLCGTTSASKVLTVNPNPTVNVGGVIAAICQGGTTTLLGGSVGGSATGGIWSTPAGGTFNPSATTLNATWTPPAGYTGTATLTLTTSGGSCGTTFASKTVTVNSGPTVNVGGAMAAICQGGTTASLGGSFGGSATGAVWSDGGAGGSFTNNGGSTPNTTTYTASATAPSSITLTLTTTGGSCGTTSDSKVLIVNLSPTVNVGGVIAAICQGGTTAVLGGSVGGSATGGTWSTPAGGTFNPSATTLNATWTPPAGYTGTATLTLTTNGGSCGTTFASKTVTVSSGPTVNVGGAMAAICQGGTTASLGGSFGGSATGAVWSDGGAGGSFANNSGTTPGTTTYTANVSAPASVTLTLTTTGGSCGTTSASKVLTVNLSPTVNVGGVIAAICQGGTTTGLGGSVGGAATGGTWSTPAGGTFNPSATTLNATWTPPAGYNGTATLTLTTSGGSCGTTFASKSVTVNSGPTVNIGGAMAAICQGGTTSSLGGSFGGSATGAVWSDGGAGGSFANNSGTTPGTATYTANVSAPASVTLTLTTTGGSCGTTSASKVLTVNPNPTVNVGGVIAAICQGGTTTVLGGSVGGSATGGTWSTPAGGTFIPSATTLNATWTPPAGYSGTATLTLTTSGGSCGTVSANKTQVVNPLPTVAAIGGGSPTVCVNQNTTFTNSTGGGIWSIAPGTGTASITSGGVVTGLTAGTVTVTYTVTNSCGPTSVTRPLTINPLPIVAAIGGGSASVCVNSSTPAFTNITGGGTWSIVPVTGTASISTGGVVTGLTQGVVTVTYTVANSCGSTSVVQSLTVNPQPTIEISAGPTCAAIPTTYSLSVTVSGGIVTVNSPPATVTNIGNVWTISNVPSGTNIIITVNNGTCQNTLNVTAPNCTCPVVNPPASGGNVSYCTGGAIPTINVTVPAGQTVDWYNAPSGGSLLLSGSTSYTPTVAGNYYALARITATSCVSSTRTPVTVTMNPLPTPLLTSSDADNTFCPGTSITFTASGGTNYNFRVGGTSVQNGALTTYTTTTLTNGQVVDVIVTNSNGCIATSAAITNIVSPVPTPSLTSSDPDNRFCSGTSVTFTASGGTSFNFRVAGVSVQSGALATYTTTTLNNGETVDVIVTNAAGCSSPSSGITNIVNALPVILLTTPPSCSVDLATYSLVVTAITGTVTTSAGTATNTSGNIWSIAGVPTGTNITITVTNSSGCKNTLDVIAPGCACPVVPPPASGGDKSYCAGGVIPAINATVQTGETVDWYNAASGGTLLRSASLTYTPTAAGIYYAAARNTTTNCVSGLRTAIIVTMNPLPVVTLTSSDADNIFCSGTSVTFTASGGVSYNFRVAGVSVQNGVTATYTTTTLRTGQVVDVIVTGANGCTATSAAITNSVNSTPTGNGGSGGNECDLDFIFKAVPSFGTGTWTLTSGPGTAVFTPNANAPNATVTVSAYGTYIFTWTEVSGTCSASSTVTVNFYKQPVAKPGTGGNNCGLEFYFSATLEDGIGTWSKVSGPGNVTFSPDPNTPNAAVTVTQFGSYTFRWTVVVNGVCTSSATVVVNFIQQTPANAGSGGTECDRDFILNASAPTGTGTWTKVSGPGNAVFSPNINQRNATVTVDQFGTYRFAWTVVNVTCSSSDVVDVIFRDLPSLNAGPDMEVCKGNTIQLNAQGTGSFAWTPAELLNNPSIKNPIATPDVSTTFKVVLTDQYGCKNSDNVLVEVREKPVADAGPDQLLEYVFETTMNAQAVNAWETGLWSIISGGGEFGDKNSAKSSVTNFSVGINKYAWTVSNRVCPASVDTVNVEVKDFLVPSLITPNMDGINDYFVLRGLETLGKTELTVFDRRGAQVYKNSNYDNSWNGIDYNENPLIGDTYYYVIKAANGKSVSGYIVIRY